MSTFGIQIQDESERLPSFVVKENQSAMELHDWQRRAINYFFNNDCMAVFEVTTGAGKTYCAIEIVKRILKKYPSSKNRILIVVPKNVILEQTWFKELYDSGFSLRDIGVYYGFAKEYGKITITNMQNLNKIALEIFNILILDEIHNYGTKRILEILKENKFKYKIGLSATVERRDNKHWELLKIFNYNLFKYTPHEALHEGILNPFNFINISVDMDDETFDKYSVLTTEINVIFKTGGGFNKIMRSTSGLKYKMLAKMNERKDLINNYHRKFDVIKIISKQHMKDKIIVFNEYNKQTNKCYWYLLDMGMKACVVHSDIPTKKREQNMMDFKNDKFNVMLTSKVLDEGYNLPKIDTAIIMAGNSTSRQTIQRLGRVLRKKDKHSTLYQIYCKNTIEEGYATQRSILFRELCSNYKQKHYDGEEMCG